MIVIIHSRSCGLDDFSNFIIFRFFLLQNPSNINLPPTKSHISLHRFPTLFTPHDNISEVTSFPPRADFLHSSFCSKQLCWKPQTVSSWALSHFHFPPVSACPELLSQTLKGPWRNFWRLGVTFWVWFGCLPKQQRLLTAFLIQQ